MTKPGPAAPAHALVLAPLGRDAAVAAELLRETGIPSRVCADLEALRHAIGDDVALLVVTEEATRGADLTGLVERLEAQPPWSDLPCIILTHRGGGAERNPAARRLADAFGNVTFIERPFHPTTFTSAVRTASKGRQRQFDARARLAELHESEERLRLALTAGELGTWEIEPGAGNLACSSEFKAQFGRDGDDDFNYRDLLASVHPEDRPGIVAELQRSVSARSRLAREFRAVWPDGALRWIEMTARAIEGSGRVRLVGVSRDITDRKLSEENLRQLNESLEDRVAVRTGELERAHEVVIEESRQRERAEKQLRQAQKMEAVGQLTGGIAHDFNNLLMAVIGNLDLLSRRLGDDAKATRLLDSALQGAKRGAALTQRLLAFSRRQDLHVEPTDIGDLVSGIAPLLERSVGASVDIEIALADALPCALVDANQMELALLNLVVNARDAMPEGGVVTIAAEPGGGDRPAGLAAGPYVVLSVSDTGVGMDADTLGRAVEPFFSTKGVGKGTGLGLSMIHGLAEQLNGALRLESVVGQGTRAEIWLPAPLGLSRAAAATSPARAEVNGAGRRALVLLVDDDALIAMSTVDMLEDLGHEVIEANSGAEALAALQENPAIELMITDYAMPRMTGAQLAREARRLQPDLPILLATGYAELPDGMEMNLPRIGKPYLQEQLAAEIAKLLP